MKIAYLLSPVHSLGPGERVCLWTQGCSKHCTGCISPELQPFAGEDINETLLSNIMIQTAQRGACKGVTISGGDPFEQSDSLLTLLQLVRPHFQDILVYTGYELEEIYEGAAGKAGISCLDYIDVLIDGRYREDLNQPECVLRGSENQRVHYLNDELRTSYEAYMKKGRILESFNHNDKMIITGIFNK